MNPDDAARGEAFDVAYLVLSGTTTAARCPELLRGLVGLGFSVVIAIPTPNAARVIAPRDLADVEGVRVVESYFDLSIRPRPPRGVVLFAPCSFNSLNKLAHGIADNLALSVVAEAIGRGTPVIVGPSLNAPLLAHPEAQVSLSAATESSSVPLNLGPATLPEPPQMNASRPPHRFLLQDRRLVAAHEPVERLESLRLPHRASFRWLQPLRSAYTPPRS